MTNTTDLNASSATQNTAQDAHSQDPYETVCLPENSLLGADDLAAFKQAAAQIQLPAQGLEKWLSYEEQRRQTAATQQRTQRAAWARQTQQLWGPQWQEEVGKAVRAADIFGGAALRQLLEETGLGNHPVMVRTFHAVAQRIGEDVSASGALYATTDKTFTQALYGKN